MSKRLQRCVTAGVGFAYLVVVFASSTLAQPLPQTEPVQPPPNEAMGEAATAASIALSQAAASASAQAAEEWNLENPPVDAEGPAYQTTVVGSRARESLLESSRTLSIASDEELAARPGRTLGDLLDEEAGVSTQTTNRGAGAPILRGQIGPSNLIVFDGVRINNGTFRTGPTQYLNLFDPHGLASVQVLRGAGGVFYGSDALGGVLFLEPRLPGYGAGLHARALVLLQSADTSLIAAPEVSWSSSSLALQAGGHVGLFNNLMPGETDAIPGTDYRQFGARASVAYLATHETELRLTYHGFFVEDAGRIDRLFDSNYRRYDNDNHLVYLHLSHFGEGVFEEVTATASLNLTSEAVRRHDCALGDVLDLAGLDGQPIETTFDPEGCIEAVSGALDGGRDNLDRVVVLGAGVQSRGPLGFESDLTLSFGAEGYVSLVESEAFNLISSIDSGDLSRDSTRRGNFSDGASYMLFGAYLGLSYDWAVGPEWTLRPQAGVRGTHVRAEADDVPDVSDVSYDFTGLVGEVVTSLRYADTAVLFVGWSQGFRAPNLQETTQLGDTGSTFEVPNPDLQPETANQVEVGGRLFFDALVFELTVFWMAVDDVIVRSDTTLNGQAEVDGSRVVERVNASGGTFVGIESALWVALLPGLALRGNASWTLGDVEVEGTVEPARRVPPLRWFGALRYQFESFSLFTEIALSGSLMQDRLSSGDEADLRICGSSAFPGVLLEDLGEVCPGTEGWVNLEFRGGLRLGENTQLGLSLSNLLDTAYRTHGSGLDAPGFNAALSLQFEL